MERCPQGYRRLDYASQKCSLYEKMAEDTENWRQPRSPAEASSSQEKRARERWAEALYTETALHELRKRNHRFTQVLASLQLKLQPFPSGASVPAASGYPLGPEAPQEAGRSAGRAEGSRLTCTFDAASKQLGLEDPTHSHAQTCA